MQSLEKPAITASSTIILSGPGAGWKVAGLTNLDRLVMTALQGETDEIWIVAEKPEPLRKLIRPSAYHRAAIHFVRPDETGFRWSDSGKDAKPILLLNTELAVDPRFADRLFANMESPAVFRLVATAAEVSGHPLCFPMKIEDSERRTKASLTFLGAGILPGKAAGILFSISPEKELGHWLRNQRILPHFVETADRICRVLHSETDAAQATASLLKAVGKESDGFVSRRLNRRFSNWVSAQLIDTSVTPNMLTAVTLFLGILGGLILLPGRSWSFIAGAAIYQLNSMLDGSDGEIARLKFLGSRFGAWADTFCDQIGNIAFAAALPVGLYRKHGGNEVYLWLDLLLVATICGMLLIAFFQTRATTGAANFNDFGRNLVRGASGNATWRRITGIIVQLARRDSYALLFLVLAILGLEEVIFGTLLLGAVGHVMAYGVLRVISGNPEISAGRSRGSSAKGGIVQ